MIALAVAISALAAAAEPQGPVLAVSPDAFLLDGEPRFLLGCSYYGALGVENPEAITQDLDDLKAHGFNWIRVWATWNAYDHNVSAVAPDGTVRAPYLDRLKQVCHLAGQRGMVVDVTVTREAAEEEAFPSSMEQHLAVMRTLTRELKPYRNLFFDVGNERNVGDARMVPMNEVAILIAAVKEVDPDRLCTASHAGGELQPNALGNYMDSGRVDFVAPHRPRHGGSPAETQAHTQRLLRGMDGLGRRVPILYQEAFRRDYNKFQPKVSDFVTDLEGARKGGAAGWCFHNGSVRRGSEDGRPRRSFDMRPNEGRLFDQLDDVERAFLEELKPKPAQH
ncbi:MAG: cellulase family glycosylhydrolase [bacterium]|nr:cellulase family glycosylhydrolase [bacterium]